jgi:hypothetical protein
LLYAPSGSNKNRRRRQENYDSEKLNMKDELKGRDAT